MSRTWIWYIPLAALAVSSAGLIVAGVLAWGAADDPHFGAWIPTFGAVALGLVYLVGAAVGLITLRRRLSAPHCVCKTRIAFGLAAVAMLLFIATTTISVVADSSRYGAGDEDSTATYVGTRAQQPQLPTAFANYSDLRAPLPVEAVESGDGSPTGFVITTLIVIFPGPISWCLAAMYFLYARGFDPVSKRVPAADPMGQILRTA